MFNLSKKSEKPTTFYALSFCLHVVAFVLMIIGMFTPYWADVTEDLISSNSVSVMYTKGLIVSCSPTQHCQANVNYSDGSRVFYAAFVIGVLAVILGFFLLQLFCAGVFIKSCRESNLGIPIAALSIFEGALLIFSLVFFEISLGHDTLSGNIHRNDTFGFSRGLVIGAVVLYWISSFIIIGEYFRRLKLNQHLPPTHVSSKPRSHRNYSERGRSRRQPSVIPVAPPPYTIYERSNAETINDDYQKGMNACNRPGCQMCNYVAESPTFWGPAGVFNITEKLKCTNNNVVYAIICMKDDKVFIGHSVLKLEDTFRVHLANIRANNLSDSVAEHFSQLGHSPQDMRISALATINCSDEIRARLEKALSYKMDRPHNSYYGINDDFQFL